MQFKKILITGGAGFIGSNLALKLLQHGYDVVVMDSLTEQIHGSNPDTDSPLYCSIKNNVEFIKGDVTSKEDWLKALKNDKSMIVGAASRAEKAAALILDEQ